MEDDDFTIEDTLKAVEWMYKSLTGPPLKERIVGRYENEADRVAVSTVFVSDGFKPIETAVSHPRYDNGKWIIVEAYDDEGSAVIGHENWVKIVQNDKLPNPLQDCVNNDGALMIIRYGGEDALTFFRE